MATATYKNGDKRPVIYTAGADIAVNEIVVLGVVDGKECGVGVALEAIANGSTGFVATGGLWEFPKVSAGVIKACESVNWDSSAGAIDDNAHTTAAGDVAQFGSAYADYGNGTTVALIYIDEKGTYDAA
jgi:predicted RecA/RadA family phage recombinase